MDALRRAAPRQRDATYRLQLDADFGFDAAGEVVEYIARLGASHVYLSPCLESAIGSAHGYDVTDPTRIDTARGGEAAFERLLGRCHDARLRVLLDIVPNHMAASEEGPWWRDVLTHGRASRFGHCFDIDWASPDPELRGRVLLPILGTSLDAAIAAGDVRVVHGQTAGESACLAVHDRRLPFAPGTAPARADDVDLAALLGRQHYVLEYWRDGLRRLNWRRFFDVTSLVGVRVEDEAVFHATHAKVLEYVTAGLVHGLRVDHPDGLRDPTRYFQRLRSAAPGAWILIEKILETDERLPTDWPVDGTTGYDFLNRATALFVAPEAESALTGTCADLVGACPPFDELQRDKRRAVIADLFEPELRGLTRLLEPLVTAQHGDEATAAARAAIIETLVAFPVYRTYVPEHGTADARDRRHLATAFAGARRALAEPRARAGLDVLERVLVGDVQHGSAPELRARFQQFSGPVIAKGVEDTALYCDRRLCALAEVGGDPGRFGLGIDDFHAFAGRLARHWPESLLATSTHDTKRSEDVRLRIAALSEFPEDWDAAVRGWSTHNARHRSGDMPDPGTEYLLYQTLVGVWPASEARIAATMLKSAREAKEHTSWLDGEPRFERALERFVAAILDDTAFVTGLEALIARILPVARVHSLAQTLVQITAPGVPDIYQGCEHWRESLVDPDNRRAVDFARLARLLDIVDRIGPDAAFGDPDGGLAKLWLTSRALAERAAHPSAFGPGADYRPLTVEAPADRHTLAFARADTVVTVVPRLIGTRPAAAMACRVTLPEGEWVDAWTGRAMPQRPTIEALFERFPVAMLRAAARE